MRYPDADKEKFVEWPKAFSAAVAECVRKLLAEEFEWPVVAVDFDRVYGSLSVAVTFRDGATAQADLSSFYYPVRPGSEDRRVLADLCAKAIVGTLLLYASPAYNRKLTRFRTSSSRRSSTCPTPSTNVPGAAVVGP